MTKQTHEYTHKVRPKKFTDLETGHVYAEGDKYPAIGTEKPSDQRLAQLTSKANKASLRILEPLKETETVEVEAEDAFELPAYKDITQKEIQEELDKLEVEYPKDANKQAVYDLLKEKLEG